MANIIDIYPTGKQPCLPGETRKGKTDVDVLQEALDAKGVGTVQLHGTFLLGPLETLYLTQSLILRGDDVDKATISGGSWLRWGLGKNQTSIPISATVENITFDGFHGGGIRIGGTSGYNAITGCDFRNYHKGPSSSGSLVGAWPIVASPPNATNPASCQPGMLTGTLKIAGCTFGPPVLGKDPAGNDVGMNNLVHVNNAFLDLLQINDNVVEDMCWFGFAVWGVSGKTEIIHNQITLSQKSTFSTPGAGISFGLRAAGYVMTPDGAVHIERNTIRIGSTQSYGILVGSYGDGEYTPDGSSVADRTVIVRDNVVHMDGVQKGDNAALACFAGCSDSNWTGNIVTGSARYGIRVSPGSVPIAAKSSCAPRGNSFVDNRFAGGFMNDPTIAPNLAVAAKFDPFTAHQAQVLIDRALENDPVGATVKGTSLEQNAFGPVSGTNGLDWLKVPCAGIACFGNEGHMIRNDFSESAIPGWHRGPPAEPALKTHVGGVPTPVEQAFQDPGVGCIYLAETSNANSIEYEPEDFPPGTVPPPGDQILDVFHSGWASVLKKAVMHENKIFELEHV